jgi:hypothetical protein
MIRTLRLLVAGAAFAAGAVHAQQQVLQTQNLVSPVLDVQRLAPQLVQFAGGDVNFQNLVNGLAFGVPVTLTTSVAPGVTQVVSFTPVGTLTATQIAQLLENARQVAIGNGIATPTAQQLGAILNGGALPTAVGTATMNGLVNGATGVTTASTQTSPAVLLQSTPRFSTSDSPLPRGVSDSPLTPGGAAAPGATSSTAGSTATATPSPRIMPGTGASAGATTPAAGVPRFGSVR